MRVAIVSAVLFALAAPVAHAQELKTEDDKTLYAVGLVLGRNLQSFNLSKAELEVVKKGITDQVLGNKAQVDLQQYGPKIDPLIKARQEKVAAANAAKAKDVLAKAKKEKGAQELPGGILITTTKAGAGKSPTAQDTVKVHYRGTLADGTEFDSSYKRNQPAEFPLGGVVKCWTDGLQKMKVGGKAKLVCPPETAYGASGRPGIPPNSVLFFDVELLDVTSGATPAAPGGSSQQQPKQGK